MSEKRSSMEFNGKVVLVTGASAGIGEAIAVMFAEHGARLALVGRQEDRLRAVAEHCTRAGSPDALAIVADLSTDQGCEETVNKTLQHFGSCDVLVNNAGVGARTNLERADMETFDRVFATNVRGVYNLSRLLAPALVAAAGNIVNISSISGSMPSVGSLPYSMSKAALDHFTRCVALEMAPKGVRVNAVSPGVTVSTFVQRMTGLSAAEYGDWLAAAARAVPQGAVCAGADVAAAVLYLASGAAARVTGVILPVDGGLVLAGAGDSHLMKQQMQ